MIQRFLFNLFHELTYSDFVTDELLEEDILPEFGNQVKWTPEEVVLNDVFDLIELSPFNRHVLVLFQQAIADEDYISAKYLKEEFIRFHCLNDDVIRHSTRKLFRQLTKALRISCRFNKLEVCAAPLEGWMTNFHEHSHKIITNVRYIANEVHSAIIDDIQDEAVEYLIEGNKYAPRLADLSCMMVMLLTKVHDSASNHAQTASQFQAAG